MRTEPPAPNRRPKRAWAPVLAALLWSSAFAARAQDVAVPSAARTPMAEGAKQFASRHYEAAVQSYAAAVKAPEGSRCVPCLLALAGAQLQLDLFKEAAAAALQAAALEPAAPARAQDEMLAGRALYAQGFAFEAGRAGLPKDGKKASASFKAAEAVLARALADDAGSEPVRMLHGRVLAAMKRDEDASREFNACAAQPGASEAECARALHFARNVGSARGEPAPAFHLETLDGKPLTLDSLAGKIVLLDFWATWCTYCERDSDYVQSMLASFEGDSRFLLVELSVDERDATWRNYVKDKRLEGVHARDADKAVAASFHVTGFPTYIVLDGEGTVRLRAEGADEGDLKGTVRKLLAESAPEGREKLPKASGQ